MARRINMPSLLWRLRIRRWIERSWYRADLMRAYYRGGEIDT